MELFHRATHIDFMGGRKIAIGASVVIIVLAIISFGVRGLNLGLDFTGGVVVEVTYPQAVAPAKVRHVLDEAGFHNHSVQNFGSPEDIMVRLPPREGHASKAEGDAVVSALQAANPKVVEKQVNTIGPQVGSSLRTQGLWALIVTLILIFVYLVIRYEWRLALGAIFATLHDVIFLIGIFSFVGWQFNLTVLAAVLAVLGYSVNDTVVVFDRIREDFKRMRRGGAKEIINTAINQTLSRTIMTSSMTMLVVIALLVFGGAPLRGFSIALAIGILVGTYSSIFIASASAYMFGVRREHFAAKKKVDAEAEGPP
ncbi:MAG: protein translocase subunit SecF [Gammaproteobacteria bacterium]